MDKSRKHGQNEDSPIDSLPYSRLFIVCERQVKEQDFRNAFSKFGTIKDIRIPCDYTTGDPKGIVYIKFAKTSEAAIALEAMNLQILPNSTRPLKVMVAANRSEIESDDNDQHRYKRLFISIPTTVTEDEVHRAFGPFGDIEYVLIQKDRNTGESKGFAYVSFRKFSEAAKAFEECDKSYRAIFALPKAHNRRQERPFQSNMHSLGAKRSNRSSLISMMNSPPGGFTSINFMCCPKLTHMQVHNFFDIVPGMVDCQFIADSTNSSGRGTVSYSNPISAAYAVEKLDKFEYPPGIRISVKPGNSKLSVHEQNFTNLPQVKNNLNSAINTATNSSSPDLAKLTLAIAEASKLVEMVSESMNDDNIPDKEDLNYCSVNLPPPRPLADIDSPVVKRCFLVCNPQPPTLKVLRDIFCRFGDLINVYTLPSKMVGYARYASTQAADNAIKTLHGAEICSAHMKVLEADEEVPSKRMRNTNMTDKT